MYGFNSSLISNLIWVRYSKRAIKRTRYRLRLLKNKRTAIAMQLRKDLAELLRSGYEEAAFNRVC